MPFRISHPTSLHLILHLSCPIHFSGEHHLNFGILILLVLITAAFCSIMEPTIDTIEAIEDFVVRTKLDLHQRKI